MSVTNAEVARRAGVSGATVSYVLNAAPGQKISAHTREKVLRAARELGYRPNVSARSLRKGRGDGVICPLPGLQLSHPLNLLLDACTAALEPFGLSLIRDFTRYDDPEQQLEAWMRLGPAAVIDVLLHQDDPVLPVLRRSGVPILSSGLSVAGEWQSSADVFAGQQRLSQVGYLLERGHRRIAWVTPPTVPVDPRTERQLALDLTRLVRSSGGRLDRHRLLLEAPAARRVVARWVRDGLPDAVAAHNDDYAIVLMTALSAQGVRVSDDVAVIGIDDLPLGRSVTPTLTTLAVDYTDFAAGLAGVVDAILSGRTADQALPLPRHRLLPRESA